MFNSMQLADLERMGAGVIIKKKLRKTIKGTLYDGVLLCNDFCFDVKVLRYWLGGGKIVSVSGCSKEDSLEKVHLLETKFEEAFVENHNGLCTAYLKRIGLKFLCCATCLFSIGGILKRVEDIISHGMYSGNILVLLECLAVAISSVVISMKSNSL